jgi:hypothetical protein
MIVAVSDMIESIGAVIFSPRDRKSFASANVVSISVCSRSDRIFAGTVWVDGDTVVAVSTVASAGVDTLVFVVDMSDIGGK